VENPVSFSPHSGICNTQGKQQACSDVGLCEVPAEPLQ